MASDSSRGLLARLKLRTKVSLLLLATSLGPLLLAGTLQVNRAVDRSKKSERARFAQGAIFAAHAFDELFRRSAEDARLMARRFPTESFDFAGVAADLRRGGGPLVEVPGWGDPSVLANLHRDYVAVFLALEDGRIAFVHPYHNLTRPVTVGDQPWFKDPPQTGLVTATLPPFTPADGAGLIAMAPLTDRAGAHHGLIGLVVAPGRLRSVMAHTLSGFSATGDANTSELWLIDPTSTVLLHSRTSQAGTRAPKHLRQLDFPGTSDVETPGGAAVVSRAEVGRTGWFVHITTPLNAAYRHVYLLIWVLWTVTLLTFFFVLLLADYLATVLLRPIKELERGAEMIGAGALDYRIELAVHTDDELGHLARAFNAMGENLQRTQRQVKAYSRNLETANRELDAMVYAITHDLKKSLRGIEAFASFLEEDYADVIDAEGVELLTSIGDNVERINNLADDLIGLVEQGRERGDNSRFEVGELLDDVRERVLDRHAGRVLVEPPMPVLMADRAGLLLVFENLIDNALKFNDARIPTVTVRCHDEGLHWRFEVEDNGIGVQEGYAERIFELFVRLNHQDEFAGSGTGLNLARRIVREHRGDLSLVPRAGGGALFVVSLPKDPALLTSPGLREAP